MALEHFETPLTVVRQIEMPPQPVDQNVPAAPIHAQAPSPEHTQAIDQVFAQQPEERVAAVDFLTLTAAGMLVHDIVKDTLATPQEEEETRPKLKPAPQ